MKYGLRKQFFSFSHAAFTIKYEKENIFLFIFCVSKKANEKFSELLWFVKNNNIG